MVAAQRLHAEYLTHAGGVVSGQGVIFQSLGVITSHSPHNNDMDRPLSTDSSSVLAAYGLEAGKAGRQVRFVSALPIVLGDQ